MEVHAKMKVDEVMEIYGWNTHQQKRFRDAVFKEGRKLLYNDEYWKNERRPDPFDLAELSNSVMMHVIENLRAQLSMDDLEAKRTMSPELVKWKLQQWISAERSTFQPTYYPRHS
ncbi:uncharacterized protein BKCO1_25000125 [Diplodia corticola]|uniref:Uncharacterized protein n=1 Tax=Diplodia corticola TaxID=236234 RepID=A0A1J9RNI0_9PEZI|nr:uncharacterized protein BKCO1_25000125 [Diplodia corticola]OJD34099.1 hypothetical protein BKCO1_25000125 [Diplodia corticola]